MKRPRDVIAELGVVPGVQHKRVPSKVNCLRWAVRGVRFLGAELEEPEGLVYDAFRKGALHVLVLDETTHEPLPELLTDESLVG